MTTWNMLTAGGRAALMIFAFAVICVQIFYLIRDFEHRRSPLWICSFVWTCLSLAALCIVYDIQKQPTDCPYRSPLRSSRHLPQGSWQRLHTASGKAVTPEMREDFRRVIAFLINAGADKGCRSRFLKKTAPQYFADKLIRNICGDLFAE